MFQAKSLIFLYPLLQKISLPPREYTTNRFTTILMANLPLKWPACGPAGPSLDKPWHFYTYYTVVVLVDVEVFFALYLNTVTRDIHVRLSNGKFHNRVAPLGCQPYAAWAVVPRYIVVDSPSLTAITQSRQVVQSGLCLFVKTPLG